MIGLHTPTSAAVEEVFYAANVKTALKLCHVRGVVMLMAIVGPVLTEISLRKAGEPTRDEA